MAVGMTKLGRGTGRGSLVWRCPGSGELLVPPAGCIGTAPLHTIAAWPCRSPSSPGLLPVTITVLCCSVPAFWMRPVAPPLAHKPV